jgi:hypothetical protein
MKVMMMTRQFITMGNLKVIKKMDMVLKNILITSIMKATSLTASETVKVHYLIKMEL